MLQSQHSNIQLKNSKYLPYFIFSTSTYSEIDILIEKIVNFYIKNQTPREEQFDFIAVNKRFLVMNYRKEYLFIHKGGYEGIAVAHYKEDTLASFLQWLNILHGSEAKIKTPILQYYIDLLPGGTLQAFRELSNQLIQKCPSLSNI